MGGVVVDEFEGVMERKRVFVAFRKKEDIKCLILRSLFMTEERVEVEFRSKERGRAKAKAKGKTKVAEGGG